MPTKSEYGDKWIKSITPSGTIHLLAPGQPGSAAMNQHAHKNPGQMFKPPGPGDTIHQKDEPDDSNLYARGGRVLNHKSYAKVK